MRNTNKNKLSIMSLFCKTLTLSIGILLVSSLTFARGREGHEGSPGHSNPSVDKSDGKGQEMSSSNGKNSTGQQSPSQNNHGSDSRGRGGHGYGRGFSADLGISAPAPDKSLPNDVNSNSIADKNNPTGSKTNSQRPDYIIGAFR